MPAGQSETRQKSSTAQQLQVLKKRAERAEHARDIALSLLADWVARVQCVGTGWDDWDEAYKEAAYRESPIRAELDAAIAEAEKTYTYR